MARQERAGEDAQAPLARAGASPRCQSHHGRSDRAAPEVATSALRDDGRSGPLGGDRDRAVAPITPRGPVSRGTGDRDIDLLVAAVAATPDAPQHGDRKFVSCSSSRRVLFAFCRGVNPLGVCLPRLTFALSCCRS
jgi:hypothetical protein